MSLLIDALKQAEASRAQARAESAPTETPIAGDDGLVLEPMPSKNVTPVQTEPRATSITRTAEPRRSRNEPPPSASAAARELFEVKRQPANPLPLILAVGGTLLLLGGAGYVWWATQPRSSLTRPNVAPPSQIAMAIPPTPTPATQAPESQSAVAASLQAAPEASAPVRPAKITPVRTNTTQRTPTPRQSSSEDTGPQIRAGQNTQALSNANIQSAYKALQEGKLAMAYQRYQEVLAQEPRNIDALNALGLIAWRSGQPDQAERMFRAALQSDPKDATAASQLALLYSEGDPTTAESRLRSLVASQPASAAAYYALGSLQSRQGRWAEAQQTLFQAYTLDSDNPDILFNLAVALEHMNQPNVARQFYERAAQASSRRPAGFDPSLAQSRVKALGGR